MLFLTPNRNNNDCRFFLFLLHAIRLVIGFVTNEKDKINIPIDSCSIDLNEFNKEHPPESYNFDFVASECWICA